MLEKLNRFFLNAHRLRRSERAVVRAGAALELEELRNQVTNPKLVGRITELLNQHYVEKAKASTATN